MMSLKEKYPEGYFDHWLAMYSTHNSEITEDLIMLHADAYRVFEGMEELLELKAEVQLIIKNDDLKGFIRVARGYGIREIELHHLVQMSEIIQNK